LDKGRQGAAASSHLTEANNWQCDLSPGVTSPKAVREQQQVAVTDRRQPALSGVAQQYQVDAQQQQRQQQPAASACPAPADYERLTPPAPPTIIQTCIAAVAENNQQPPQQLNGAQAAAVCGDRHHPGSGLRQLSVPAVPGNSHNLLVQQQQQQQQHGTAAGAVSPGQQGNADAMSKVAVQYPSQHDQLLDPKAAGEPNSSHEQQNHKQEHTKSLHLLAASQQQEEKQQLQQQQGQQQQQGEQGQQHSSQQRRQSQLQLLDVQAVISRADQQLPALEQPAAASPAPVKSPGKSGGLVIKIGRANSVQAATAAAAAAAAPAAAQPTPSVPAVAATEAPPGGCPGEEPPAVVERQQAPEHAQQQQQQQHPVLPSSQLPGGSHPSVEKRPSSGHTAEPLDAAPPGGNSIVQVEPAAAAAQQASRSKPPSAAGSVATGSAGLEAGCAEPFVLAAGRLQECALAACLSSQAELWAALHHCQAAVAQRDQAKQDLQRWAAADRA
jgi:hypothetical protein